MPTIEFPYLGLHMLLKALATNGYNKTEEQLEISHTSLVKYTHLTCLRFQSKLIYSFDKYQLCFSLSKHTLTTWWIGVVTAMRTYAFICRFRFVPLCTHYRVFKRIVDKINSHNIAVLSKFFLFKRQFYISWSWSHTLNQITSSIPMYGKIRSWEYVFPLPRNVYVSKGG